MEPALLIPLGVFAMLVAFSYLETRKAITDREALSREYLAAIEKGLPPPAQKDPLPTLPDPPGHPLKATLAALGVGIALWAGLPPHQRIWGMVVTAFGIAGLVHWVVAGHAEWRRRQRMHEEMHQAFVDYLKALTESSAPGDGRHA